MKKRKKNDMYVVVFMSILLNKFMIMNNFSQLFTQESSLKSPLRSSLAQNSNIFDKVFL